MISLRLSEAEYAVLKSQFKTYGARNVSDLARSALHQMLLASISPHDDLASKVADLDGRFRALESQVSFLMEREKVTS